MAATEQLDLFPNGKLAVTLQRLCHELLETYGDFSDTVIIGAQSKGVFVSRRIQALLQEHLPGVEIPHGELDTTFFRDDFRMHEKPLQANKTRIDFLIEDRKVILIDDVLYTGRSVRAALDAMLAYGRPRSVELLVLVDRRNKRHLPIEPSYVGIMVDTIESQRVLVSLKESGGEDSVILVEKT
ncbi:MAG: bifunctional pyr operon transcriptional regulator/uracil phosphoribosyltransferase PyrR [Bacteroidia bacterium]|nr:bifunctional pyr operon transcriptional regulator/uracil phosphoribosyltransferase PyrR [Bacteroidia bacterium]